jgi:hypothetical protein
MTVTIIANWHGRTARRKFDRSASEEACGNTIVTVAEETSLRAKCPGPITDHTVAIVEKPKMEPRNNPVRK